MDVVMSVKFLIRPFLNRLALGALQSEIAKNSAIFNIDAQSWNS
jgi:hypothetical protein